MNNLPPALRPIYTTDKPNEDILLYDGTLEISTHINQHKVQTKGTGKLKYAWFPNPHIQFSFSNQEPHINDILFAHLKDLPCSLTLSDIGVSSIDISITSCSSGNSNGNFVSGRPKKGIGIAQGNDQYLAYILFHVANFHDFLGKPPAYLEDNSGDRPIQIQRLVFETDEWKITLDQLKTTTNNVNSLNSQGGFAITHVGKLEKLDGQTFSGKEAREFLKILADFLSFARGFSISVILLIGYDTQGNQIWEYWEESAGNSWKRISSWCPKDYGNKLTQVLPGFLTWWENWEESERLALYWYLEANYNPLAEQNILVAQIALELIAWVLIVEKDKTVSKNGFDRLPASDKLRILFSKFNIPLEIPCSSTFLNDLRQLATTNDWIDGSHAFTSIRNAIVHPETKKRNLIYNAHSMAKIGTAYLGLWYLELTLLAMFKYQEHYSNRTENNNLEVVPWSKQCGS